jgi:hypothetical protein
MPIGGHTLLAASTPVRDSLDRMIQQPSRRDVAAMRPSSAASPAPRTIRRQAVLPLIDPPPDEPAAEPAGRDVWIARVRQALAARSSQALEFVEEALRAWPIDPELLLLAALTTLAVRQPERALALLKRYGKRYVPGKHVTLLNALALGQQGHCARAWAMLQAEHLDTDRAALGWFVGDDVMRDWLVASLGDIRLQRVRAQTQPQAAASPATVRRPKPVAVQPPATRPTSPRTNAGHLAPVAPLPPAISDLPRLEARFDMSFELANADAIEIVGAAARPEPGPFQLRSELVRLSLFEGFDELLCLSALQGVEAHWYQVETVRKVLKHYRGRVLLADEVGLGKTVEAGMVLKEYLLRGMAERILILTPAPLVGQWRDEMARGDAAAGGATGRDRGRLAGALRPTAGSARPPRSPRAVARGPRARRPGAGARTRTRARQRDLSPARGGAGLDALSAARFPRLGRLGRQARLHPAVWRQSRDRGAAVGGDAGGDRAGSRRPFARPGRGW